MQGSSHSCLPGSLTHCWLADPLGWQHKLPTVSVQIKVRSGSWIDAIRFTYASTNTPWRGNNSGGDEKPSLTLAANEWITQAWVRSGAFVDEVRFLTNTGRYWSTSDDTTQSGSVGLLASPCPGAYRYVCKGHI